MLIFLSCQGFTRNIFSAPIAKKAMLLQPFHSLTAGARLSSLTSPFSIPCAVLAFNSSYPIFTSPTLYFPELWTTGLKLKCLISISILKPQKLNWFYQGCSPLHRCQWHQVSASYPGKQTNNAATQPGENLWLPSFLHCLYLSHELIPSFVFTSQPEFSHVSEHHLSTYSLLPGLQLSDLTSRLQAHFPVG